MLIKKIKSKEGIVIISVLLLMAVFILLTTSMLYISTYHLQMVGNVEGQINAQRAAESGVEFAISKLSTNASWGLFDPKTGKLTDGSSPDINIKFSETGSEFFITFNSNQTKDMYSYNNLFTSTQYTRKNPDSKIPPYNMDLIIYGKSRGITKILRVMLIRDDVYPYDLNTNGQIMFRDADKIHISGEKTGTTCSPGTVHSNWKGNNIYNSADYYSITKNNQTKLTTYKGVFSSNGKIDMRDERFYWLRDPANTYDCTFVKADKDVNFGKINIENDIVSKAKSRVDKKDPTIVKINGPTEIKFVERYGNLAIDAPGFPSSAYTLEGDSTLKLQKDIYVESGNTPASSQKNLWVGDPDVLNNSLSFKRENDALFKEYNGKSIARNITLDLNGHTIYSKTHVVLGVEVTGTGSLVSEGKLTYLQGVNTQSVTSISEDDLDIELDKSCPVNQAKGLFYTNDDFRVKPIANTSPLYGEGEMPDVRNKVTLANGSTVPGDSGALVMGEASLTWAPTWFWNTNYGGYWDYGYKWIPVVNGNNIVMARMEQKSGDTYVKVSSLPNHDGSDSSLKIYDNSLDPGWFNGGDPPDNPPALSGKNIDFGEYDLVIIPTTTKGKYNVAAMKNGKILGHSPPPPPAPTPEPTPDPMFPPDPNYVPPPTPEPTPEPDPEADPFLNDELLSLPGFPNITAQKLASITKILGDKFYNMGIDKISIEGVIVSHNSNVGDYEGMNRSIELDILNPAGEIDVTYNKDYMQQIVSLRGSSLGVRVNSWQEIK